MIIYKTTNLINNKIYIGQDSKNNSKYYGSGVSLIHAIKKYGKENFKKEILEFCDSKQQLDEKEIYWISELNSTDRKIGYNICKGGQGALGSTALKGIPKSEEHKKNISKNHADVSGENNPMFGKNHTADVKEKLRNANLGKKLPESVKLKMSEKRKGEKNAKAKLTQEDVLKIRELYFIENYRQKDLALTYNVQDACIFKILTYRTWKHI